MIVTDTAGLLTMASDANGRNRSVHEDLLAKHIDWEGTHVMTFQFPHNDVEWRTHWLVKLEGSLEPASIWLDVSFEAFNTCTWKLDPEVVNAALERHKEGAGECGSC